MTDKQIMINNFFREIYDIDGNVVDYEIKNSDVSKLVQKIEKYNSYIKRKEQECEILKDEHKILEDNLDSRTRDFEDVIDEYKQTLTEIKDIINEFAKEDILTFPDFSKEQNYKLIQKQCGEPILKILQKINEVKNVESN